MKNFYEVVRVYIWQNCPEIHNLNGKETTVTGDARYIDFGPLCDWVQPTDTPMPFGGHMGAPKGYLRPKYPPPGEKSISDLFKLPELEPA